MGWKEDYGFIDSSAVTTVVEPSKPTYKVEPLQDLWRVSEELSALGTKIDTLNNNIERLIRLMTPPVQQLLVEPMTFEQAKERVASYMKDNRTASISELAERLQIDLQTLCEVLDELSEEGHIKERE